MGTPAGARDRDRSLLTTLLASKSALFDAVHLPQNIHRTIGFSNMDRRTFLIATANVGLTGCVATPAPGELSENGAVRSNSKSVSTTNPVRCQGEPVSVEQSLTDTPGYDDDLEYFPANETFRIVVARDSEGPAMVETVPFDEWASIECAEAGQQRVHEATRTRLGTDGFGSSIGEPSESYWGPTAVILSIQTQTRTNGTTDTPPLSLSRLARVAPQSVAATVSLQGDTFSRTVAVFAEQVDIALA